MVSWKTGRGEITIGEDGFFAFAQANNQQVSEAKLPFRVLYEEVPCLRQKVLEDYQYEILEVTENPEQLRLRVQVAQHFRIDLASAALSTTA